MARRVENIILVSSTYDTFILQEDGQLSELILGEFLELNLHHTTGLSPRLQRRRGHRSWPSSDSRFNLIVSAVNVGDMNAVELAPQGAEAAGMDMPGGAPGLRRRRAGRVHGRPRYLAPWNASSSGRAIRASCSPSPSTWRTSSTPRTTAGWPGCRSSSSSRTTSATTRSFLPLIYTEIIRHSQTPHRRGHQRRPQDPAHAGASQDPPVRHLRGGLGATSPTYQENVLGVISDVEFPQDGKLDPEAGAEFARCVKQAWPDVPVILQSSRPESEELPDEVGARFLLKGSPTLLDRPAAFHGRQLLLRRFRLPPAGRHAGRASQRHDELLEMLHTVPAESITYHADRNHFSRWLKARTEFHLAHHLRPTKPSDYEHARGRAPLPHR